MQWSMPIFQGPTFLIRKENESILLCIILVTETLSIAYNTINLREKNVEKRENL